MSRSLTPSYYTVAVPVARWCPSTPHNCPMEATLPWHALLVGGASGVGKSRLSRDLARHYGVGVVKLDDFQVVLEAMASERRFPALHYWRSHPDEARRLSDQEHRDLFVRYSHDMSVAVQLLIANHRDEHDPVVIEGDFLLPAFAVAPLGEEEAAATAVDALFVLEDDRRQIAENFLRREGHEQPERARVSSLVNELLRDEVARTGAKSIAARPWDSALARAVALLEGS